MEMEPIPEGLINTIPAENVDPPHIEYAIVVRFMDGRTVTFPQVDPLASPQVVAILQPPESQASIPTFVILYPKESEVLFAQEVRIAVSIFDPDSSLCQRRPTLVIV